MFLWLSSYPFSNLRFKAASPAISSVALSRPLPSPRLRVPSIVVYTAYFNIIPNPLSVQSFPTSTTRNATRDHYFTTSLLSAHPTQSPSKVSRLAPVSTASRIEKGKSGAVGRGLSAMGGMQDAGVMQMMIGVKAVMELDGFTRVNGEEMKFRLVFIVWPALIGLSMAVWIAGTWKCTQAGQWAGFWCTRWPCMLASWPVPLWANLDRGPGEIEFESLI